MTEPPHDEPTASSPEELREQVEHTREELGQTVETPAAKTDVKARAQEKAAEVKEVKVKATGLAHQSPPACPVLGPENNGPLVERGVDPRVLGADTLIVFPAPSCLQRERFPRLPRAEVGPRVGQPAERLKTAIASGAQARPVADLRDEGPERLRQDHPVLLLPLHDGFMPEHRLAPFRREHGAQEVESGFVGTPITCVCHGSTLAEGTDPIAAASSRSCAAPSHEHRTEPEADASRSGEHLLSVLSQGVLPPTGAGVQ
jgi:hypothetical protein